MPICINRVMIFQKNDIQNIETLAHGDIGSLAEFKEALKESSKNYEC